MKISYTQITTVFLGICVIVSSEEECDLECEIGYVCRLRRGNCEYPPCPMFPTCHPVLPHQHQHHHHQQQQQQNTTTHRQRHRSRHTSGHNRHHTSRLQSLLLSPESPTTLPPSSERPGQCPVLNGPCITTCRSDGDCTADKKCCDTGCGQTCRSAVEDIQEKPGTCPRHIDLFSNMCTRECASDLDCGGVRKCCGTGCGSRCTQPCFYWIHPNQRSGRKSILWKLPFVCRT